MAKRAMVRFLKNNFDAAQRTTNLNWYQLFQLAVNFGQQYGPDLLNIITAVTAAIKGGSPATAIAALVVQYGPEVMQMAEEIAAMFGIVLPPSPSPVG
jgi:hypothetical protein